MPEDSVPEDSVPRDPAELSEFILRQSAQGIAVPVLLFGPGPGAAEEDAEGEVDTLAVGQFASRLGIDLREVDLHSAQAYLLQCGLGQELLDALGREDG